MKERNEIPWPSAAGASKRNKGDGKNVSNALQARMTQLMDPPMFPSILGTIILQGMVVMAVGLLGMIINLVYFSIIGNFSILGIIIIILNNLESIRATDATDR